MQDTIEINGVTYKRVDAAKGNRAVVVVDRGWIFAGDVTEENGRILLSRAVHVLSWESVGFAGLIADPKSAKAKLKLCADVDLPKSSEIFRVQVGDTWGL